MVSNNDMVFSRALRTGKSGENSMAFDSMHKHSGKKYITKSLLRSPQTSAYLNAKREVFSYSLSEKLSLGIVPHAAHLKITPKKIRFNGQTIDDYNLPMPAPFGLIDEYVISRKIEGSSTQEMVMGYNRKQSPLYVFNYILGQADREDSYTTNSKGEGYVRNILFDKNGNMYAIDHSIILHPSLNDQCVSIKRLWMFLCQTLVQQMLLKIQIGKSSLMDISKMFQKKMANIPTIYT